MMFSRRQFEQALDHYLTKGDQLALMPFMNNSEPATVMLVEALIERFDLIYQAGGSRMGDGSYQACINITYGIWRLIKSMGELGLRVLKRILMRESALYRNVAAFLISAEDQPHEQLLAVIQSLGERPDTWQEEPGGLLLVKPFELAFEKSPFSDFRQQSGMSLDEVLNYLDIMAVDFICERLGEHQSGNLTVNFLSENAIAVGRDLGAISGWRPHPTNLINDWDVHLFNAPIERGLMAANIHVVQAVYKKFHVTNGTLLGTASHLIVFDSRTKTAFGFPYREISTVSVAGEDTYVSFRDNTNLTISTSFPKPGIIGTLAILGAPPEQKLFHYTIEQDRARSAENFLGLWSGFFNDIVEENRLRLEC